MLLYQIPGAIRKAIDEYTDLDTGEIKESAALDQVQAEASEVIASAALYRAEMEADEREIALAIKQLSDRRARLNRRIGKLEEWMLVALRSTGSVKTPQCSVSIGRSPQTVIDDLNLLPDDFKRITVAPDKKKIKDSIKQGVDVPGAHIDQSEHVTVRLS